MQVPGYGLPDMRVQKTDVALQTTVITGTVTAKGAGFFAGPRDIYTPFSVEVDQVVRGDATVGPMQVAVEGGNVGCSTLRVYYGAPIIEPGNRYVFFLEEPIGTASARTYWDAWPIDPSGVVATVGGPMPLTQLIDRIDRLAAAGSSATP